VIHIDYDSNLQAFSRQLATYWQNLPSDAPPNDLFLINEHGDKIPPARFTPSKGGAMQIDVVFPRVMNNEPVIRATDKVLRLQFTSPQIGDLGEQHESAEFKLDKMALGGKTVF